MKPSINISEAELEVMKVLWRLGEGTSSDIVRELIKTTDWKPKTIQTLISRLVSKEVVKSDKLTEKTFQYRAVVGEEEYKKAANQSFLKRVYNGSLKSLMVHFMEENTLTEEDIAELRHMLDEKEVK